MKKISIYLFFLVCIFSCKKKDTEQNCTTNTASIAGSYKITAVAYKANTSATEVDFYQQFFPEPCDRDDILTFNVNGTWVQKDAGIVCSPSNDDNGSWSVTGQTMFVDGDAATIKSFNCKQLVLTNIISPSTGEQFTITLTKQ